MNTRILSTAGLLVLFLATSGCSEKVTSQAAQLAGDVSESIEGTTAEDGTAVKAMNEARQKLRTENFPLSHKDGGPKAEITPEGDFLIDGKAVAMTDAQREALVQYRSEMIEVADAGIALGQSGVVIAGKAVSQALSGFFGGGSDEAKTGIEAEAKKMEAAAMQICHAVEALIVTQDALSAVLPEFAPYAGKIKGEVDCTSTHNKDADSVEPTAPTISA